MKRLFWTKGSEWARKKFRCDYQQGVRTCGRPVRRLAWHEPFGEPLPVGGYCYAHHLVLKRAQADLSEGKST